MAEVIERVAKLEVSATELRASLMRLETRIDAGLAEGRRELQAGLADVRSEMRAGFTEVKESIARTDTRFDALHVEMRKQIQWMVGTAIVSVVTILVAIISTR